MESINTLKEIINYFLFIILFFLVSICLGVIFLYLVTYDTILFILKRTGETLWLGKRQ